MKHLLPVVSAILLFSLPSLHAADSFLVKDGNARAEIVIAEQPQRSARLAAQDLQDYLKKISGAHLPIVTQANTSLVQLYVGQSTYTDQLQITAAGLKDGAYRIVSGDKWLVLLGEDTEFSPIEPWARSNAEIVSGKAQREWDQITGASWGLPNVLIYKDRLRLPGDIGLPDAVRSTAKSPPLEIWQPDERGSFNAVAGYLGRLGVRWYLPGELGEVIPKLATIPLLPIDETVRPDFPLRRFSFRFGVHGTNMALWAMRLGLRDPYGIQTAHGLDDMTNRESVFAAHPDWFAMYGGRRRFQAGQNNQLCYSNDELFEQTVRNVRWQFDHYQIEMVSVMPPDGYTAICQCPRCAGKETPTRDQRGLLSDYVWGFVNRVAQEVRKTHPDKKIINCAYGVYTLPPQQIARLEPNVVVSIVGGRSPLRDKPQDQAEVRQLRAAWLAKTSNPIIVFENYPFTDRGWYLPFFVPHTLGAGINETKGNSYGEDISLAVRQEIEKTYLGFNHFLIYFTQRMYWGGKEQDVDAMFREYCRLFYGPAEHEMQAFFEYCEAHWQEMEKDKAKADHALALFAAAQSAVSSDSEYGRRVALIDDFLKGLRSKSAQLGKKRGPVPQLRLVGESRGKITIDGQLDDEPWLNSPVASTGRLRELQTGRTPALGTTVKTAWMGNDLYVAIRCAERPGEKLNIATTKHDDGAIWYGDVVEVNLETESHSYYQIAVSPSGAVADLDRAVPASSWFSWDAQAEVATSIADDHWIVEMRIPVTQDENDPLHQVIGRKPTTSLPWHINICRQRIRDTGQEYSAYSPTGTDGFHVVEKFAHFYDGNSFTFDRGEVDADFLEATRIATVAANQGQAAEALAAYTAAAAGKVSDLQKSFALEQAAGYARALRQHDLAAELAARIPLVAVRKTVLMHNLLDQFKAPLVVEQFGQEDFATWPFWKIGDGAATRGQAAFITRQGALAERDLLLARTYVTDENLKGEVLLALGGTYRQLLKDDRQAIAAYRQVYETTNIFKQCAAAVAIAEILREQGKQADARAELERIDASKLTVPYYRELLMKAKATVATEAK